MLRCTLAGTCYTQLQGNSSSIPSCTCTYLGYLCWVDLHILLQLLYLAAHGGVNRFICADGLPSEQLRHERVVCFARLHRRRLGDTATAHTNHAAGTAAAPVDAACTSSWPTGYGFRLQSGGRKHGFHCSTGCCVIRVACHEQRVLHSSRHMIGNATSAAHPPPHCCHHCCLSKLGMQSGMACRLLIFLQSLCPADHCAPLLLISCCQQAVKQSAVVASALIQELLVN
jgi:hypothetical protein